MLTEFEEHIVKRSIRSGGPGSRQLFKTEEVRRLSIAAFMHNPNWCGGGDLHQMAMHGCSCVLKITVYFLNKSSSFSITTPSILEELVSS